MRFEHTAKRFDVELDDLAQRLARIIAGVSQALSRGLKTQVGYDPKPANEPIAINRYHHCRELDEAAVLLIARRQPVAVDLREIVASTKANLILKEIGTHADGIIGLEFMAAMPTSLGDHLCQLSKRSLIDFCDVGEAFVQRDREKARRIKDRLSMRTEIEPSIVQTIVAAKVQEMGGFETVCCLARYVEALDRINDLIAALADVACDLHQPALLDEASTVDVSLAPKGGARQFATQMRGLQQAFKIREKG
jgi:phosphate transport system protein